MTLKGWQMELKLAADALSCSRSFTECHSNHSQSKRLLMSCQFPSLMYFQAQGVFNVQYDVSTRVLVYSSLLFQEPCYCSLLPLWAVVGNTRAGLSSSILWQYGKSTHIMSTNLCETGTNKLLPLVSELLWVSHLFSMAWMAFICGLKSTGDCMDILSRNAAMRRWLV